MILGEVSFYSGIPGAGVGVLLVFCTGEEEELVLDNRASDGSSEVFVKLLGHLDVLVLYGIVAAIHVLIVVEAEGAAVEFVGTRLGHYVDGTAGETTLTYVKRSHRYLQLVDSIQRDRQGITLAAIGSLRGQAKDVVADGTVNLEGVVTVVASRNGDTAILGTVHHGVLLGDILNISVDGGSHLDTHVVIGNSFTAGVALGCDYYIVQHLAVVSQLGRDFIGFAQSQ